MTHDGAEEQRSLAKLYRRGAQGAIGDCAVLPGKCGISRSHPLLHDRHVRRYFGQHLQPQRRDTADAAIGD